MEQIVQLSILLFSIVVHEFAHGWVADKFGDNTAKIMGRLTLNPIPHIDMVGTIMLPLFSVLTGAPIFGWAKPVPVDPSRLNRPLKDMVWVSFAGPLANFLLALTSSVIIWFLSAQFFPLGEIRLTLIDLFKYVLVINVILAVFNLIPIPPLDGSKILLGVLPGRLAYMYLRLEPYGFMIILFLLFSGMLWAVLGSVVSLIISFLMKGVF